MVVARQGLARLDGARLGVTLQGTLRSVIDYKCGPWHLSPYQTARSRDDDGARPPSDLVHYERFTTATTRNTHGDRKFTL